MADRLVLGEAVMIVRTPTGENWPDAVLTRDLTTGTLHLAASAGLVGRGRVCLVCLATGQRSHRSDLTVWASVEEVS